jgi:hypothetical protein
MNITLTREEAQSVLDDLEALTAYIQGIDKGIVLKIQAIETLLARLSEPEPEPVRLRRGDILRCIETNELCTVWATSTTGKTQVKWKANDFGSYTAEQIGDLFWVEPKPEPEPVAWMNEGDIGKTDWKVWAHGKPTATIPLYTALPQRKPWDNKVLITDEYERGVIDGMQKQMQSSVDKAVNKIAQREWRGLTGEEIEAGFMANTCCDDLVVYEHVASAIEAKLKEKNT